MLLGPSTRSLCCCRKPCAKCPSQGAPIPPSQGAPSPWRSRAGAGPGPRGGLRRPAARQGHRASAVGR
eukprot:593527-Alexandrium_andersonii.AAC.1